MATCVSVHRETARVAPPGKQRLRRSCTGSGCGKHRSIPLFYRNTATMGFQNIWFSHPRKFGQGSRSCRVCANQHGIIRKYGLNMCRQCFRSYASDIGFKKLD